MASEELSPPPYQISPQNHGGYILVTAVIFIILSGLAAMVKLWAIAKAFKKFRLDDFAIIAGLIFALGYTIATCQSVNHGLGSAEEILTLTQTRSLGQFFLAANVLSYPALAFSKCSVALLIISIQPQRWIIASLYGVCAISIVWAIVAAAVTATQCGPHRWVLGHTDHDSCIDQYAAQVGIKLVDIITDVALVVLPIAMILSVQFSVWNRFVVSFMFGMRIVVPSFTAVTLASQSKFYDMPTSDRPFAAVVPSVWTSIALNLSVITACLPALKRFLMDVGAGIANGIMADAFEMQQGPINRSGYVPTTGEGSRDTGSRSRYVSQNSRSREERRRQSSALQGDKIDGGVQEDETSREGSTDGILRTTGYEVLYEADDPDHQNRSGSVTKLQLRSA
ncbi:hypothetical protein CERZMDRAFT_92360 [Cercospora zeae-maydis SCOH1-5]|uniref:Rhodopsin domain-containing protein n=1 Tax=Cercospora zeae-maydis SCOH1-5 TaxID=717836 RepID=A0A6A6FW39_9PEZI|nr:hypothetical protein CERZMDRAFT_92360 [Cercospora zeae-maydis SCOH1-5]